MIIAMPVITSPRPPEYASGTQRGGLFAGPARGGIFDAPWLAPHFIGRQLNTAPSNGVSSHVHDAAFSPFSLVLGLQHPPDAIRQVTAAPGGFGRYPQHVVGLEPITWAQPMAYQNIV